MSISDLALKLVKVNLGSSFEFVGSESLMLHTMLKGNQSAGFGEDF